MWTRAALLSVMLVGCAGIGVAHADIISPTPTFPPAGATFSGIGAGCFPVAGVCADPGTLKITSSSSTFSPSGQDIMADVTFSVPVTTLLGAPLGTFTLTGTMELGLDGRTAPDQTGSWPTDIDALDLSGTIGGLPATVGLNASEDSGGTTSILPAVQNEGFRISSFFDVFVDLQLGPFTAQRGPISGTLVAVPEPASWALLCLPVVALGLLRRRPVSSPTGVRQRL